MMNEPPRLGRQQWFVLIAAFLGWMFDGLEMGLFPIAARPALQDLMNMPSEAALGQWYSYLMALFLVGAAAGGFLFGWMGDRMGRVRTMALSIAGYSIFTGLGYFATAPWHLGACRFLAALGMGGEWALGVALVMECWPERLRPLLAGVIGMASNVGFLAISVVGISFEVTADRWRWIMLAGAAPGVLAVFIIFFIPESQRWAKAAHRGAVRPLREIFTTNLLRPTLLGIVFASVALIGTWGAVSAFLPPWADQLAGGDATIRVTGTVRTAAVEGCPLLRIESVADVRIRDRQGQEANPHQPGRNNEQFPYRARKWHDLSEDAKPGQTFDYRLVVTNLGQAPGTDVQVTDTLPLELFEPGSIRFEADGPVQFDRQSGQMRWTIASLERKDSRAKAWIQAILAVGAIVGSFFGPLLANRLGRRPSYFLLCLGSLASAMVLFGLLDTLDITFLVITGVVGIMTASFYGWLPLYLPELFPTRVRATGQGIAFNAGRIFAAVGALTTGQLMGLFDGSYPKACAAIALAYVVGMVAIWLAPETKDKPLPE